MICVKNISMVYGKKRILENISFRIETGIRVAITGRNGSGKSTLLQIMAGVVKPQSGTISYFDKEVSWNKGRFSQYCGYVPQDNPLLEELTVLDNLRLWNGGYQIDNCEVIRMNGLEELLHSKVSTLSGGMKRRLSIACAMVKMPPVMLMDEPTTALDRYYKEQVWDWMKQYQAMHGTIVLVSHDKEEIGNCNIQYRIQDAHLQDVQGGEENE